ncbi:hypothetical protein [Aquirufa sp. 5-AUSEE-100C1]
MNEPNNTSWEELDKVWRKKIQEQADDVPANLWDKIETRLDEQQVRPMWTRVRMSPWTWSAAAVIAILIGLNWDQSMPEEKGNTLVVESKIKPSFSEPIHLPADVEELITTQVKPSVVRESLAPSVIEKLPNVETQVMEEARAPIASVAPKEEESEEIWVRVDIDPVKENAKPVSVAYQEEPEQPKQKKSGLGRFLKQLRQVVKGEQPDWEELREGKPSLVDGIHQVANTYYRTEQTVKQTFQIQ